jgi:hypothetical protein
MNRPCICDKIGGNEFVLGSGFCYSCWCWYYREDMRVHWGGPIEPPTLPASTEKPEAKKTAVRQWLEYRRKVSECEHRLPIAMVSSCGCRHFCKTLGKPVFLNLCIPCQALGVNPLTAYERVVGHVPQTESLGAKVP